MAWPESMVAFFYAWKTSSKIVYVCMLVTHGMGNMAQLLRLSLSLQLIRIQNRWNQNLEAKFFFNRKATIFCIGFLKYDL